MLHHLRNLTKVGHHIYSQRIVGFPPPGPAPHMPREEQNFFEDQLIACHSYVEFGSGGSTVMASRLGVATTSVESDAYYARVVASQLQGGAVKQIISSLGLSMAWGMPAFPRPKLALRYVSAPWVAKDFPDFILVDGRYRVACVLMAAQEAFLRKSNAIVMFDDYFGRPAYIEAEKHLGAPDKVGRAAIFQVGSQQIATEAIHRWLLDPI